MARNIPSKFKQEADKQKNRPVELFDLFVGDHHFRFTNNNKETFFFDPDPPHSAAKYIPFPIEFSGIRTDMHFSIENVSIGISNVSKEFLKFMQNELADIRGARVVVRKVFLDLLTDPTYTAVLFDGIVDSVEYTETLMSLTVKSKLYVFKRQMPQRPYSILCPWKFGGSECTVDLNLPENKQFGTAESGSTSLLIIDSSRTEADRYWVPGIIQFSSGDNEDLKRLVVESKPGQIKVMFPFPYTPKVGDTYIIWRDCGKTYIQDCRDRFDNISNFGGFPTLDVE